MASFLEKVNSFTSRDELRQWAVSAGLEFDPSVVQRITALEEDSWFDAVSDPILLEALDGAQAEEGSQLNDSDLQLIEAVEDMEQNPINGIAYYCSRTSIIWHSWESKNTVKYGQVIERLDNRNAKITGLKWFWRVSLRLDNWNSDNRAFTVL